MEIYSAVASRTVPPDLRVFQCHKGEIYRRLLLVLAKPVQRQWAGRTLFTFNISSEHELSPLREGGSGVIQQVIPVEEPPKTVADNIDPEREFMIEGQWFGGNKVLVIFPKSGEIF